MTRPHHAYRPPVEQLASFFLIALLLAGFPGQAAATNARQGAGQVNLQGVDSPIEAASKAPAPGGYPFFFNESGLPHGTNWSVEVGSSLYFSNNQSSIEVRIQPAITPVNVTPVPGFVPGFYHNSVDPTAPDQVLNIPWHPFLLNATFNETGLPVGKAWEVTFANTTEQTTEATMRFEVPNGTYFFSVSAPAGYHSNVTDGNVSLQNQSILQMLAFSLVLYDLSFEEFGLPVGQAWSVQVGGTNLTSTSAKISIEMPNGTLGYRVAPIAGFHASLYSGSLVIAGVSIVVSVNWTQVTYPAAFSEIGLPDGVTWGVTIVNETALSAPQPSLVTLLPNGTYAFTLDAVVGYRGTPSAGTLSINGAGENLSIQFVPETYVLTVAEDGLPSGVPWGISLAGSNWTSHTSTLNLSLANGSWPWRLEPVPGFHGEPSGGTFTVHGTPQTVVIRFLTVTFPVLVTEQGLPQGTTWEVLVEGIAYPSHNTTLSLSLPNGTYPLEVGPEAGYSGSSTPSTALTVNGVPATIMVVYNLTGDPAGHTGPGFVGSWQSVSVLLFVTILGLCLVAYLFRRQRSRRHR